MAGLALGFVAESRGEAMTVLNRREPSYQSPPGVRLRRVGRYPRTGPVGHGNHLDGFIARPALWPWS